MRRRKGEAPPPNLLSPLERAIVADLAKQRFMDALATRQARAWLDAEDDQEHEGDDGNARRYPPRARS